MSFNLKQEDVEEYVRLWNLFEINKVLDMGMSAEKLVIKNKTDILLEAILRKSRLIFLRILKSLYNFNCNDFLYLHHAVRAKDIFFVERLLKKMSLEEINKTDLITKNNALHIATEENLQDIIVLLSKYGVAWNKGNYLKQTPLHLLLRNCAYLEQKLLNELQTKEINIKIKDVMGISAKDIIKSFSHDSHWYHRYPSGRTIPVPHIISREMKRYCEDI